MPRIRLFSRLSVFLLLSVAAYPQTSATGEWGPILSWPLEVTHASLLPNGKVIGWSPWKGDNAHLWDPSTNTITASPKVGYNIFCAGHSHLADGRVLVTGGQLGAVLYGLPNASIYDPKTDSWSAAPNMHAPRWYPTNTSLGNGDVLVTSGQMDPARGYLGLPQVFQAASNTWQDLSSAQLILPLYPRMILAPNGKVFYAGESTQSRYLDTTGTGQWTAVAKTKSTVVRDYGSAVQYGDGKIVIMGGGSPPTATTEVIDLNAATPAWRTVAPMSFPRRQLNATLLPGGQVLVTGGSAGTGFSDKSSPVLPAELWDPKTETWSTLASQSGYRGYHSVALLLPDATVLSAGGDPNISNAQIFSPPYLFNGARPTITSAPPSIDYGASFAVGTPNATGISQVTLLRLGSVTHAFNQDQRFNNLSFTAANSTSLNVIAPANANLAPAGDYMLFVLNTAGVPSVARFIHLNPQTGALPAVAVAPSSVFLPDTVVTSTSAGATVTLTNNQSTALTISNIAASGDFAQTNTCTSPVSAGASCKFTITFTPTALGLRSGKITITDSANNSPQVINMSGNGVGGATTSATDHNFWATAIGTTRGFKLYLLNNQSVPLNIASIVVTGADFSQTNHCTSPLAAGQFCDINMVFAPTVAGTRTGMLTITDSANNSPQTVPLTGFGK